MQYKLFSKILDPDLCVVKMLYENLGINELKYKKSVSFTMIKKLSRLIFWTE